MDWLGRLTFAQAALVALAWPAGLLAAAGLLYLGFWVRVWWQARQEGRNASGSVAVTVTSWPALLAYLGGPAVAVLLLWALLRLTTRAT